MSSEQTQGLYRKDGDEIVPAPDAKETGNGVFYVNWGTATNAQIAGIFQLTYKQVAKCRPVADWLDYEDYAGFVCWPHGRKSDAVTPEEERGEDRKPKKGKGKADK